MSLARVDLLETISLERHDDAEFPDSTETEIIVRMKSQINVHTTLTGYTAPRDVSMHEVRDRTGLAEQGRSYNASAGSP
jgi:hypothetical protein